MFICNGLKDFFRFLCFKVLMNAFVSSSSFVLFVSPMFIIFLLLDPSCHLYPDVSCLFVNCLHAEEIIAGESFPFI